MTFAWWSEIFGVVLIMTAVVGSLLKRLPLSSSMLYLAVGYVLGPAGIGFFDADPFRNSELFERLAEAAVLVSLFVAGLKLSAPMRDRRWILPTRLAFVSMAITVGLVTLIGVYLLGLPVGAAVLLGAILAPTDPVLAADVQVEDTGDRDRLRFALTGEAGLNDGTAFPFVMLGLGLLGLHEMGSGGWRWVAVDVVWAIAGGIAIGGGLGYLVGKFVHYLRVHHKEATGFDELLGLGLIALTYGTALLLHTYGFLAVFAAGLALRRIEDQADDKKPLHEALQNASAQPEHPHLEPEEVVATDARHATAYLTHSALAFHEQLERIGEIVVVVIIGALLGALVQPMLLWWLVPLLFLVARPVSVWVGLLGTRSSRSQRWLTSWFGIRGIGSIYYLMYAINHDLDRGLADRLLGITIGVVAASIVLHGISVTPLMKRYSGDSSRGRQAPLSET